MWARDIQVSRGNYNYNNLKVYHYDVIYFWSFREEASFHVFIIIKGVLELYLFR
jgi:hypothetical protein